MFSSLILDFFLPGILDASRAIRPGDVIRLLFAGVMRREEFAADIAKRAADNTGLAGEHDPCKIPDPGAAEPETAALSGIEPDPEVRPLLLSKKECPDRKLVRSFRLPLRDSGTLRSRWQPAGVLHSIT